jgi:hypothetical protein
MRRKPKHARLPGMISVCLAAAALFSSGACGGRTSVLEDFDSGFGDDSSRELETGTHDTGGDSSNRSDADCIAIDTEKYDRQCNDVSDCFAALTGTLCQDTCICPSLFFNKKERGKYEQALRFAHQCSCVVAEPPACVKHTCAPCIPTDPNCFGGDSAPPDSSPPDASPPDHAVCAGGGDILLTDYTTSCLESSECIAIASGAICPGDCLCARSTINRSSQMMYDAVVNSIRTVACDCPFFGRPTCANQTCVLCGGPDPSPAGCGDGGL